MVITIMSEIADQQILLITYHFTSGMGIPSTSTVNVIFWSVMHDEFCSSVLILGGAEETEMN